MDYKLLIIPGTVIIFGVIFMFAMSARGKKSGGKAQACMKNFVIQEYPCLESASFSVINLLENTVNAQHIWVVAYDKGGLRIIPATSNPFTQTLTRYEEEALENEYIPYSAITSVTVDESRKKIILQLGNIRKSFKYQMKDCFGAPQEETVKLFFQYLKQI